MVRMLKIVRYKGYRISLVRQGRGVYDAIWEKGKRQFSGTIRADTKREALSKLIKRIN